MRIILTMLMMFVMSRIVFSQCYESNIAYGKQQYNAGQYEAAKATFQKALSCGDAGAGTEARQWINSCTNASAENCKKTKLNYGISLYNKGAYKEASAQFALSKSCSSYDDDSDVDKWIKKCNNHYSYSDDFSKAAITWSDSKDENKYIYVSSGYLKAICYNTKNTYLLFKDFPELSRCKNFELSIKVRFVKGTDDKMGLTFFCSDDRNSFNRFAINGDKTYYITSLINDEWDTDYYGTDLIRPTGEWNSLKVVYDGIKVTYYLNGQKVHDEAVTIYGNAVGVSVSGGIAEGWFDDLSLTAELYSDVYEDDFSTTGKTFSASGGDNYKFEFDDGMYKGYSYSADYSYSYYNSISILKDCGNFDISLDIKIDDGNNMDLGFLFGGNGADPSNRFGVTAEKKFYVGKYANKKWDGSYNESEAIKGSGEWNTLRVLYSNNTCVYLINSTEVYRKNINIYGTSVGVYFNGGIKECSFDNLIIKAGE